MATRFGICGVTVAACLCSGSTTAYGFGRDSVTLSVTPDVILADGKSTTIVSASIRDSSGNAVPDGTPVSFVTSGGSLSDNTVNTQSGVARITLTSSGTAEAAIVTATAFISTSGSATGSVNVVFTKDRDAVANQGEAGWTHVECPQELLFSADTKIIEAHGRHGTAHFSYRTLDITADSFQLNAASDIIIAHNAVMKRGTHVVKASRLFYDLVTSAGTGVVATAKSAAQAVTITGYDLDVDPVPVGQAQPDPTEDPYAFQDLSNSNVVVTARAIAFDQGHQIQFQRATIYSNGQKILSMPLQVMPLDSDQIFGQQVLGVGSLGFFVNIPYYYHVSPGSTGTLYLRNSAAAGADQASATGGQTPLYTGSRPGLALDLEQKYTLGNGGSGTFLLNSMTRSDWGARWTHSQRFGEKTSAFMFMDFPGHRSLFGSTNVSHQFTGMSLNFNASASNSPAQNGFSSSSRSASTYLQFDPVRIKKLGLNMVDTMSVQDGQYTSSLPNSLPISTRSSTIGADARFFTDALRPDPKTTVSDSLTIGQDLDRITHRTGTRVLAEVGMTRAISNTTHLSLNYNYRYDPFHTYNQQQSTLSNVLVNYNSPTQQRVFLTFNTIPIRKMSFNLSTSYGLPLRDSTLFSNATYHINDNWGLGFSSFLTKFGTYSYRDMELTVSRRFLGRYFLVSYSTQAKKFRFDLSATGF